MWHVELFQKCDLPKQLNARTILRSVDSNNAARETSIRLQALLGLSDDQESAELIRVLALHAWHFLRIGGLSHLRPKDPCEIRDQCVSAHCP
jgi:hypothetical protein